MRKNHIPLRTCIACHEVSDKNQMLRIVRVDKKIFVDELANIGARGAYIHHNLNCAALLKKHRMLNKLYRTEIGDAVYDDIMEKVKR